MGKEVGDIEEAVKGILSGLTPEQRISLIQSLQSILNSELLKTNYEVPDMACPVYRVGVRPLFAYSHKVV